MKKINKIYKKIVIQVKEKIFRKMYFLLDIREIFCYNLFINSQLYLQVSI